MKSILNHLAELGNCGLYTHRNQELAKYGNMWRYNYDIPANIPTQKNVCHYGNLEFVSRIFRDIPKITLWATEALFQSGNMEIIQYMESLNRLPNGWANNISTFIYAEPCNIEIANFIVSKGASKERILHFAKYLGNDELIWDIINTWNIPFGADKDMVIKNCSWEIFERICHLDSDYSNYLFNAFNNPDGRIFYHIVKTASIPELNNVIAKNNKLFSKYPISKKINWKEQMRRISVIFDYGASDFTNALEYVWYGKDYTLLKRLLENGADINGIISSIDLNKESYENIKLICHHSTPEILNKLLWKITEKIPNAVEMLRMIMEYGANDYYQCFLTAKFIGDIKTAKSLSEKFNIKADMDGTILNSLMAKNEIFEICLGMRNRTNHFDVGQISQLPITSENLNSLLGRDFISHETAVLMAIYNGYFDLAKELSVSLPSEERIKVLDEIDNETILENYIDILTEEEKNLAVSKKIYTIHKNPLLVKLFKRGATNYDDGLFIATKNLFSELINITKAGGGRIQPERLIEVLYSELYSPNIVIRLCNFFTIPELNEILNLLDLNKAVLQNVMALFTCGATNYNIGLKLADVNGDLDCAILFIHNGADVNILHPCMYNCISKFIKN